MKTIDDVLAAMQASLNQYPPDITVSTPAADGIAAVLAAMQLQLQLMPAAGSADELVLPSRYDMVGMMLGRELLVRKHRSLRDAWSFLCPQVTCQRWTTGFQTVVDCRVGWFKHSAECHDPNFTCQWPEEYSAGEATQPVCSPGDACSQEDLLLTMVATGDAVDRFGRPLTFDYCTQCPDPGKVTHHKAMSGRTCVRQVVCPKCNAQPGEACDRSTSELSPVRFGKDNQASAHDERFAAARAADRKRWNDGDLTLAAAWKPAPVPSARKRKPSTGMTVWLVVDAPADYNEMWRSLVSEYNAIGRLRWSNGATRAHIGFPSMELAAWSAAFIAQFYGISSDLISVDAAPVERPEHRGDYAWMVFHDAEQVLRNATADTPNAHVAWAAGVLCTKSSADLLPEKLTLDSFVQIAHGGTPGGSRSWECDRAGWRLHLMGKPWRLLKKLSWGQVIQAIQGRITDELRAEMRAAEAEVVSFPHGSVERFRAASWSLDVALEAWMAARPVGLAPFVALTAAEVGVAQPSQV